jgi:hypothetical protein
VGIPYLSDGWGPYETTIKAVYREREPWPANPTWAILKPTEGIRLTQVAKHRKGRRLDRIDVRATIGDPIEQPHLVHLERLNGVLRDRLNCLTRKTHGFAKEEATWDALFSLVLFDHNWLRPHIALHVPWSASGQERRYSPRSPALALGLTDHVWSWEEFLHLPVAHRLDQSRPASVSGPSSVRACAVLPQESGTASAESAGSL